MHAQVAVVVVSYNTRELLLECLASVAQSTQSESAEIVVVDNASDDGSYDAVRQAYPQTSVIRNSTNLGFAAACNQAIKSTSAQFILLLNSDARLTAQAFIALYECLDRNERCGAAGCRLIDASGADAINTRNFLTPFNQACELAGIKVGLKALRRTHQPNLDGRMSDCSVEWIDGACLMLRRAALDDAGLFDERFFMYSEDEDLCFRLRKRGWLVCFCAGASVAHHGGASSRLNKTDNLRHFFLSQMLFLSKHRGGYSVLMYEVATWIVLGLKTVFQPEGKRREAVREQLSALREARASRG
jgi:GT2 family glycosyltransferase